MLVNNLLKFSLELRRPFSNYPLEFASEVFFVEDVIEFTLPFCEYFLKGKLLSFDLEFPF